MDGKDVGIIGSADGPTFILVGEDLEADTVDGKDVGIIGSADSPTFILVREDSEADAEAAKKQREANLTALGGVVGQTNVLLNDKCIAFTDAAPEAQKWPHDGPAARHVGGDGRTGSNYDQATATRLWSPEKRRALPTSSAAMLSRSPTARTVKMDVGVLRDGLEPHDGAGSLLLAGTRLRRFLGQ